MSLPPETYKVYIASDHAGFALKRAVSEMLSTRGYPVVDFGAKTLDSNDDYPDFITPCATRVAQACADGDTRAFGIVIGGSGQGEAMSANRVVGVRAAVFYGGIYAQRALDVKGTQTHGSLDIVRLARLHNDANILSLGARFISEEEAFEAVILFIETPFSRDPRHIRRISKF